MFAWQIGLSSLWKRHFNNENSKIITP